MYLEIFFFFKYPFKMDLAFINLRWNIKRNLAKKFWFNEFIENQSDFYFSYESNSCLCSKYFS